MSRLSIRPSPSSPPLSTAFQFGNSKLDKISLSATPIELLFEDKFIAHGTGFIWNHKEKQYLITSWHNLTGQNPFTGKHLSPGGKVPDSLRAFPATISTNNAPDNQTLRREAIKLTLYETFHKPQWTQHQYFNDLRIDIAALELSTNEKKLIAINDYGYEKIFTNVGSDLFIVGYPFSEFDEFKLPIWKKGSLASEPFAIWNRKPAFLIDAASRRGMSGSPIIRRVFGPASVWINRELTTNLDAACTSEFIGIYSGHLHTNHADVTIGIGWYANLIDELLSAPHDGSRLFQA